MAKHPLRDPGEEGEFGPSFGWPDSHRRPLDPEHRDEAHEHDAEDDEPLWTDPVLADHTGHRERGGIDAAGAAGEHQAKRLLKAHSPRRAQRRQARLDRPALTLPIAALIDVVFLLLVFFLLVTDFSGPEEVFRVDLPPTAVAEPEGGATRPRPAPTDPFRLDRQPLRVLVTSTGPRESDFRLEVVGIDEPIEGFDGLERSLRRQLVDPTTRRGLYLPDQPVVLEPSPATSWGHSVGAFNAVVRAGYTNVVFRGL